MATESKPTDRLVIGSQYFLYFGVLGMYLPFFNLYCYHLGFSGLNIGILSAVRSVAMVVFPLIWGTLADRLGARRSIYILCSFASALIWMQYLFTVDFSPMLAITIVYGTFYAPIISFLEAFTMDILGKEKKSYGHLRVWGSISFITVVLVLGKIIDLYSIEVIVVLILAGLLMFAFMSTRIPATKPLKRKRLSKGAKSLLDVRVLVFLFCAFLMLVSHGAYYGFFSIHLEYLGYGSTFIGLAWAFASAAEILVMIRSEQIFQRFSLESVLIFSFMVAALRWFVLFWAQSAAVILASQVLHAITYGAFHIASILFIDRLTPDKAKTLGQAANNALSYGLGLMVGFFFNGYLYEISGSFNLFMISSLIALSGGLIFWGFYVVNRRRAKN
jgi:PPP family 3-phenylpropionic acid transporter